MTKDICVEEAEGPTFDVNPALSNFCRKRVGESISIAELVNASHRIESVPRNSIIVSTDVSLQIHTFNRIGFLPPQLPPFLKVAENAEQNTVVHPRIPSPTNLLYIADSKQRMFESSREFFPADRPTFLNTGMLEELLFRKKKIEEFFDNSVQRASCLYDGAACPYDDAFKFQPRQEVQSQRELFCKTMAIASSL